MQNSSEHAVQSGDLDSFIEDFDSRHFALQSREEIVRVAAEEMLTVQDMVRYTVSLFSRNEVYVGHGTDNYWDEALELVQSVMFLQPPCDESTLSSRMSRSERIAAAELAAARIRFRVPLPYLTHRAFFAGHQFYVDRRVIVPRSPFAELINSGFAGLIDISPKRVLDMCTGSACMAIAVALKYEGTCEVDAVDISADALEVAQRNIEAYGLEDLVIPIQSDLFAALPEGDKYDLIISNPPYVCAYDLETMPEEYHCEPEISLGSGEDGLDCTRRILAEAGKFLNDDGVLLIEVGNSIEFLEDLYPEVPFRHVELQNGGHGIFMLTASQLKEYADVFAAAVTESQV